MHVLDVLNEFRVAANNPRVDVDLRSLDNPLVLQGVRGRNSALRVPDQALTNQILAVITHIIKCRVIEVVLSSENVINDFRFSSTRKRYLTR